MALDPNPPLRTPYVPTSSPMCSLISLFFSLSLSVSRLSKRPYPVSTALQKVLRVSMRQIGRNLLEFDALGALQWARCIRHLYWVH